MARVVTMHRFGGPEVLELSEESVPAPGPGEVRLAVRAIGLNPIDVKVRSGMFGGSLPIRLGGEAAGVVTEVGEGVDDVKVGDEVIAYRASGAYASELVVPAGILVPKPASLPWEQAAGLLLTGTTAVHALETVGLGEGDVVLVHGAAGGVGQMLLQLARQRGATVIGTASERNFGLVRELGGIPVAYGPGLADRVREAAGGHDVTAAIDVVGTKEAIDVSLELVADHDRIVTAAGFEHAVDLDIKKIGGGPDADPGVEIRERAKGPLAEAAGRGELVVRVAATFPLTEVAAAHELLGTGHANGKVILVP